MKILIVDDEPNNRILLQKIMAPYGDCITAVDGLEAVEIFEFALTDEEPVDIIMLDIMMPRMDGQEALKRIRALEKEYQIPAREMVFVFMVSALDTEKQVAEAFFRGYCTDFLSKPITSDRVLRKLKEYGLISN